MMFKVAIKKNSYWDKVICKYLMVKIDDFL